MSNLAFCEDWGERLAARHPKDLSPTEQANLRQHLLECPQCAAAYAAFNALETHIRELPQAGPLPSLLPKLQNIRQDPAPSSDLSYDTIFIDVECPDSFAEILPDDMEKTELAIEDVMSHVLLRLFDGGMVEEVTLRFAPGSFVKRRKYSIQIRVCFLWEQFTLTPRTQENMRLEMQKNTSRILKELFTSVEVAKVTLLPKKEQHLQIGDMKPEFG